MAKKNTECELETEVLIIDENYIKNRIYMVRGQKVMLDYELAEIYGYTTTRFNEQVKNNIEKFDNDFMFQLTKEEFGTLMSQGLISKNSTSNRGGRTKPPKVFTEQGIYMLMTVLKGEKATVQSKALIRTFKKMKDFIIENQGLIWQREYLQLSMQISDSISNTLSISEDITANHFAENNDVTAIEPSEEMLANAWKDYEYTQIVGDASTLFAFKDETFDIVICHNVLEYIDDKDVVLKELARILKKDGILSIAKHNRAGRVMQMAVLLDDFEKANELLDGDNSTASKFGAIRYYEDQDICNWVPELTVSENFGIRTFWDLQQNQEKHGIEEWQNKMMQLEMRVAQISEYRDVAFFHHLILKKCNINI